MFKVYWQPEDKVVEGDLNSLKSKKTVWVDCLKPTKAELERISEYTGIAVKDFLRHKVQYERPTTIENENYSLIVFGAPVSRGQTAEITSVAIFMCKNQNIVSIRTEELISIDLLRENVLEKNPKYFEFYPHIVQGIMEKIIDSFFQQLSLFREQADKIETKVIHSPHEKTIEETFRIKKSLLFLRQALVANREVILSLDKEYLTRLPKKSLNDFKDMHEDILELIDGEDTLRRILTGILEIYASSLSTSLNKVIKKLTVIASYVLIPTLIASIYGMNFRNMPEIPWKWGYMFSLGLMLISIILVYTYFRKAKLL